MKKIIALCSVIVAVALIITCFAACGNNTEDDTTTTAPETTAKPVQTGVLNGEELTVSLEDEYILIKKGDEVFQKLGYPSKKGFEIDFEFAKNNFKFMDMNFDGVIDFYMGVGKVDGNVVAYCWLYNATSNKFEHSVSISALKNLSVDPATHTVYSSDDVKVYEYGWNNGVLEIKTSYAKEDATDEKATEAVNNKTTAANDKTTASNNKTTVANDKTTASNNKTTVPSAPLNTTTTAAATRGYIEVVTGGLSNEGWK